GRCCGQCFPVDWRPQHADELAHIPAVCRCRPVTGMTLFRRQVVWALRKFGFEPGKASTGCCQFLPDLRQFLLQGIVARFGRQSLWAMRLPVAARAFGRRSGELDRNGRISRCGDEMMRVMLYEAAQSMLRSKKWSWLKAWAMQIARRRGIKKAIVALARRLAVIMHRIWVDGTEFRWTREQATAAA